MIFSNIRLITFAILLLFASISNTAFAQSPFAPVSYNLPSNFIEADCVFKAHSFNMSIKERNRSTQTDASTYFPAVVGDLDGDGFGEIVIPGGTHNASEFIYIFNHKAELLRKINLPTVPTGYTMNTGDDSVLLVDFNNDGKGEIVVTASNGRKFFIFDHEGNLLASENYPTRFPKTIGVADFNNDGIPELIGVDASYKVAINSLTNPLLNTITPLASCSAISTITEQRERTFALADIDLDGTIDVVTVVPIANPVKKLEVKVWNPLTGNIIYSLDLNMDSTMGGVIRNSWPFIGDTDGNKYPDIIFMGGLNTRGHTSIYRVEYDKASNTLIERAKNNGYEDFSSMSTSMSMFDFNNDGKQEIIYRDESSLYIINGENLTADMTVPDCYSGTGWEYPVVASLTPSGESSIIMCSGSKSSAWVATGSVRIYGADTATGAKPWMPARKVWNQYSFYQNTIYDDLTIIPNPAPLNAILTSTDGKGTTMQPFNGHMMQLGIIKPSTLESIHPLANVGIDIANIEFGFNRVADRLSIEFDVFNTGSAPMDPKIAIDVFKYLNDKATLVYTDSIDQVFYPGNVFSIDVDVNGFEQYYPLDSLVVHVAKDKYDCDTLNNKFTIYPEGISGVLYVKKGNTGEGATWQDAMGELSDALNKAAVYNARYPYSLTQIWVAEGAYYGNFTTQEGVNIHGGLKGVETEISQSRPLAYPTILDAQGNGRPLTQSADYTVETTWGGLTLQNGNTTSNGGGASLKKGGILMHSIVKGNKTSSDKGAGIYTDGGNVINTIVDTNVLTSTSQGEGAGIYATNGSLIKNNTIVSNTILATTTAQGAGLYANASTVANNIIYKNSYTLLGGNAMADNFFSQGGVMLQNLANNDDSVDPLFLKFEDGNYRLLPTSPALNIGDNASVNWELDIEGNERIYKNKTVDQGAFEYQSAKVTPSTEGYFYVNKLKDGEGADWTNAVKELSDAITGAKHLNENAPNTVKQIWVAAGTYNGVFEMVEGANVHGGFAGNENDFNKIDTVANKTYVDAQGLGRALSQTKDFDTPTEWAGFILQNGLESAIDHDVYGGGAYLKKNGTLRYSTIRNSKAVATSISNKVNAYGGGVYLEEGANILNAIIDNNTAEVNNTKPATIQSGVAQGGGANSVNNRLAYLIVRNNKTISGGNTDGSAIYSTGDIVNNVVNSNKGKSAIYIGANKAIVNSTIVANEGEHTISGEANSQLKNSIVFDNKAIVADFDKVEYLAYKNLVKTNPIFEVNSFRLSTASPARTIGDPTFFPTDLTLDMEDNGRIISLKNNVKIIDAGAYQSKLKVVSATEATIEVPFGTDFSSIDFHY